MLVAFVEHLTTNAALNKTFGLTFPQSNSKVVTSVAIQVIGNCRVTLTGKVCDDAASVPIKAVNMATLEGVDAITDTNVYTVPTEALCELTLNISDVKGTATVVVKGLL